MTHATAPEVEGFALSPHQQELWEQWKLRPAREIAIVDLWGFPSDPIAAALGQVVARHEILRTSFVKVPGMKFPLQQPKPFEPQVEVVASTSSLHDLRDWLRTAPIDPRGGAAFAAFIQSRAGGARLGFALPSLLADAQTTSRLVAELYGALVGELYPAVEELPQYADVAAWLNSLQTVPEGEEARAHWENIRAASSSRSLLPLPAPDLSEDAEGATTIVPLSLPDSKTAASDAERRARFVLAWRAFIARIAGERTRTALLVSGRSTPELAVATGPLARALPIDIQVTSKHPAADVLAETMATIDLAEQLCDFAPRSVVSGADSGPLVCSVRELDAWGDDTRGARVIEAETWGSTHGLHAELLVRSETGPQSAPRLRLSSPLGSHCPAEVEALAHSFAQHVEDCFVRVAATSEFSVELDAGREAHRFVSRAHTPALSPESCDSDKRVIDLFVERAKRRPEAVAIRETDRVTSYGALAHAAAQVAREVRAATQPGAVVGILAPRSREGIALMLGVVASGRAYVPLDPSHPAARIEQLVHAAGVSLLLSSDDVPFPPVEHDSWPRRLRPQLQFSAGGEISRLEPQPLETLAYVLFTSGSTGAPKGVAVPHRALRKQIDWFVKEFSLTEADAVAQRTPLTFDASVWEVFAPLMIGAELLVTPPAATHDMNALADLLVEHRVTALQLVPSLLAPLLETLEVRGALRIERLFVGGEPLAPELAHRAREVFADEVINLYGPTECTVQALAHRVGRDDKLVAIGKPVAGSQAYVLDQELCPLPIGAPGEIALGGECVALGYWNDPRLTAERFVPDPHATDARGARMYRSGDIGCMRKSGELHFLGRDDEQVKLRGMRVNLLEVESALRSIPDVTEAAACVYGGVLQAYLVAPRQRPLSATALRETLARSLPDSLVPTRYFRVRALPRLSSGKIDRNTLLRSESARPLGEKYEAPRSDLERHIAAIWSELLELDDVGAQDRFFEAGGHSLLATQVLARVRSELDVDVPLDVFIAEPTVASTALYITSVRDGSTQARVVPTRAERDHDAPRRASLLQERLWLQHQVSDRPEVLGSTDAFELLVSDVQRPALVRAAIALFERHELLRSKFEERDGQIVYQPLPTSEKPIRWLDLRNFDEDEQATEIDRIASTQARQPFDLQTPPLLRLTVCRLVDRSVLIATVHQLVCDEWSMQVMIQELVESYRARCAQEEATPPPFLPYRYADWADWQRDHLTFEDTQARASRAGARLAARGERPSTSLDSGLDPAAEGKRTGRGDAIPFAVDAEIRAKVLDTAKQLDCTEFAVVLASYAIMVRALTGRSEIRIGTPVANRSHYDDEAIVGPMINTAVHCLEVVPARRAREIVAQARESVEQSLIFGDIPLEYLLREYRLGSVTHLFDCWLAFQNTPNRADTTAVPFRRRPVARGASPFPLGLLLEERDGGYVGILEYDEGCVTRTTAQQLVTELGPWLCAVADATGASVCELAEGMQPAARGRRRTRSLLQATETS